MLVLRKMMVVTQGGGSQQHRNSELMVLLSETDGFLTGGAIRVGFTCSGQEYKLIWSRNKVRKGEVRKGEVREGEVRKVR